MIYLIKIQNPEEIISLGKPKLFFRKPCQISSMGLTGPGGVDYYRIRSVEQYRKTDSLRRSLREFPK